MTLLDHVMTQLEGTYASEGKSTTFAALKIFLRIGDSRPLPTYEELSKKLNIGVASIKTLVHRLRKRYSAILRKEVARTLSDPVDVDAEIHALCDALIATEGRIG